jgi:hypothetical protein
MSRQPKVAVIIGSLRKQSYSRKVANALIARAPPECELPDRRDRRPSRCTTRIPPAIPRRRGRDFGESCARTKECCSSRRNITALYRVASRGLPVGVVSVTPYKLGAFGANHALRQTFVYLKELLQSGSSGGLAFWTGLQHAEVQMDGRRIPMTLRITEVFRVEERKWKLAHRHADMPPAE